MNSCSFVIESVVTKEIHLARKIRLKIGEVLLQWKTVNQDQVTEALNLAKGTGKRIGEAFIEIHACCEEDVAKALAHQFGMEFLNLERAEDNSKIDLSLMPNDLVRKHLVLPLSKSNGRLKILVHDPMDLELFDNLRFRLNAELDTAVASKRQMQAFLDIGLKNAAPIEQESLLTDSIDKSVDKNASSVDKSKNSVDADAGDDAPLVRLVNRIIIEAVRGRASDIHVEPMTEYVRVRYRIDGECVLRDKLPKKNQA